MEQEETIGASTSEKSEKHPAQWSPRGFVTEAAVYGVILVSGLILVTGQYADASWDVFLRTLGTVLVFWAAHVYAGTVAHLGDGTEGLPDREKFKVGFGSALLGAIKHSTGLLVAALIPSLVLLLGAAGVLSDNDAIWGALWIDTLLLGILGYIGVARWATGIRWRLLGALCTALFGIIIVALKVLIH